MRGLSGYAVYRYIAWMVIESRWYRGSAPPRTYGTYCDSDSKFESRRGSRSGTSAGDEARATCVTYIQITVRGRGDELKSAALDRHDDATMIKTSDCQVQRN